MGLKHSAIALFTVSCLTCGALDALATDNPDSFALSPEQLFNATVTSVSKTSQKLMDAPAAIYVLTNEDIMRSGATSIPEALRIVPGVQVARVNANTWAIGIRGFNGTLDNKLLVLIDGRTIYDPLYSGVYWDIQDMVLEDIDRIEVIRGPGAALWGANAVNGVINIITKKAADTQGNLASATLGNQDGIAEERYGGTFGDNGFYRVYAKYTDRNDEQALIGRDARDGQAMDHSGFRSDWKGTGNDNDNFTFQGDVYRSNESQYRYESFFSSPFTRLELEDIYADGGTMLGRWTRTLSDDSKFTLQSYADYTSRDQLLLKDQRATFDVDSQYDLPAMGRHKITVGAGYRYSVDGLTPSPQVTFDSVGDKTQSFGSFIQDKITLEPKTWFLTLGSKFEHNTYTGFEVEPDARLQWQPDDSDMVWAAVSRAVRTPSRLEEALSIVQLTGGSGFTFNTIGDTSFESEELIAYELGYRKQFTPKISLDVSTFYNDYQRLSTLSLSGLNLSTPPLFLNEIYTNRTTGNTCGFETTANWRAMDTLNLSASYSLLEMYLSGPPGNANAVQPEMQSPDQQFNLRAQWDISKNVSFDTMLYYVSELPYYNVQDYTRLDMRLGWRITDGLEFSVVGQDLLNSASHEFTSPTAKDILAVDINRAFYGKLTWRF